MAHRRRRWIGAATVVGLAVAATLVFLGRAGPTCLPPVGAGATAALLGCFEAWYTGLAPFDRFQYDDWILWRVLVGVAVGFGGLLAAAVGRVVWSDFTAWRFDDDRGVAAGG